MNPPPDRARYEYLKRMNSKNYRIGIKRCMQLLDTYNFVCHKDKKKRFELLDTAKTFAFNDYRD